jgi:NDP-sugar pyrophosphorylase family protein
MIEITCDKLFESIPPYLAKLFNNANYPWDVLENINSYIKEIYEDCLQNGFTEYSKGVLMGKNASIATTATIIPPAIIGHETEVRHCAYIRGNVITGIGSVIGNSCEIKNSVILDYVQIPHFNYVGDSVIGNYGHLGAGVVCSNLKSDKSLVKVKSEPEIETGLKKFGAVLADHAEVGCGSVLNPGTIICKNARIYPLTSVRGVIPPDSIMKSVNNIVPINNK